MEFQDASSVDGSAIVLTSEPTKKGDRLKVELQIIGGPKETVFPTLEDARALGVKAGKVIDVDIRYEAFGMGESKRGDYVDKFTTYRMRVFLARPDEEGGAAPTQSARRERREAAGT